MNATIVYEGVSFVVAQCAAMSREEFIRVHIGAFWPDRDRKTRRKLLTQAYNLITSNQ